MATLPLTHLPATGAEPATGYWLFGRRADLGWFVFSVAVPLLLYLPTYWLLGSASVWPLYLVYVAGFATPHLWLTWAVTVTPSSRGLYSWQTFGLSFAVTGLLVAAVPLTERFGGWDLFFTVVTLYGVYHIFKQHLGILKIYDAKYAQVHGDPSVFRDLVPFHRLCTLAFALPVFWVWQLPPIQVVVGIQKFTLLTPHLPAWSLAPYYAAMAGFALWTLGALRRRHLAGKPLPTAHLALAAAAGLSYWVAFALVPTQDYLLTLAIFITYHDLQYWGFVWHFQRRRSLALEAEGKPLDWLHRLARDNRIYRYFGVAFLYSALVVATLVVAPPTVAIALVVFYNVVHYVMDGYVWKRRHHPLLPSHLGLG